MLLTSYPPLFREFGVGTERRRSGERRSSAERRNGRTRPPGRERRTGGGRRRQERRDTAQGHLRNSLQMLLPLASTDRLDDEAREAVMSAMRRVWLGLLEIERDQQ